MERVGATAVEVRAAVMVAVAKEVEVRAAARAVAGMVAARAEVERVEATAVEVRAGVRVVARA